MKLANKIISKFKDQRGVTAVWVALAITMLVGFAALAVDIGYLMATKNELQNAADAAALAAAGKLGDIYVGISDPENYFCDSDDEDEIESSAQAVVGSGKNMAGWKDIAISVDDIFINNREDPKYPLFDTNNYNQPDAVRVIARRDSFANDNLSTIFAKVFGANSVPVTADATAALSGLSVIPLGGLPIPVGIGKARFNTDYCDEPIKFYPTNDPEACGGWHVFTDDKTKIKQDILDGELAEPPTWTSPEIDLNDPDLSEFYFKGGTDTAAFDKLKELFDLKKGINDYWEDEENDVVKEWPIDGDLDSNTWTTSVVVYDWEDCANPNTDIKIIGFSAIRIYEICTATSDPTLQITGGDLYGPPPPQDYCVSGEKQIVARISCGFVEPSRGGGGEYGIMGAIPGLVE